MKFNPGDKVRSTQPALKSRGTALWTVEKYDEATRQLRFEEDNIRPGQWSGYAEDYELVKPIRDFDVNYPYGHVTRSGLPARIICTNREGEFSIVALLKDGDRELVCSFTLDGNLHVNCTSPYDLFNAPDPALKKFTAKVWINYYGEKDFTIHMSPGVAHSSWAVMQGIKRQAVPCIITEIEE